ncbi:ArsR/SmtB family transcription factor [Paenarthrobacter sp. NPDC090522]|uniref:ArsR/SmtB family transcription factor n=1 Tax=Paenarthrobacter sp. NPDC090522 TaxID=3364383 RepID=UPI00380F76D0
MGRYRCGPAPDDDTHRRLRAPDPLTRTARVTDGDVGALANPSRRTILDSLLGGPLSAGELTGRLALSRSSASEHLTVLKDAGLIREERQGRHRIYHLQAAGLQEVSGWLQHYEHYWNQRLDALGELLDKENP